MWAALRAGFSQCTGTGPLPGSALQAGDDQIG